MVEIGKDTYYQKRDLEICAGYCRSHPKFDNSFVQECREQFLSRGFLTDDQYTRLINAMDFNKIDEWATSQGLL